MDFFSSMPLNDDRWHRVVLTKVMDEVTMIVDSFKPVSTRIPFEKFWFGDHILLGI